MISTSSFFSSKPFTYQVGDIQKELSKNEKVFTIAISLIVGIFTVGVGGILTFFWVSKELRDRNIKKITLKETPVNRLELFQKKEGSGAVKKAGEPTLEKKNNEGLALELPILKATLNVCTLSSTYTDPWENQSVRDNLQGDLDAKKIPLQIGEYPRALEYPNKILKDSLQLMMKEERTRQFFLKNPDVEPTVEKYYNSIDCVSLDELKRALKSCSEFLNDFLGNYAIGFNPKTPHEWVFSLAVPHLKSIPSRHFPLPPPYNPSADHPLPSYDHCVVFNDVDYTGEETVDLINSFRNDLKNNPQKHLYIVVPFTSLTARNRMAIEWKILGLDKQVHLVTGDRPLIEMKEKFTEKEIKNLIKFNQACDDSGRNWDLVYFSGSRNRQIFGSLSITEWYTPLVDVPETLLYRRNPENQEKYRMVTNYAPPYAKDKSGTDRPFIYPKNLKNWHLGNAKALALWSS